MRITLPHNGWTERPYQHGLWDYLQAGGKRALAVWHRRAGKDEIAMHYAACAMHTRIGNVWHCLPEFLQGRKAIWTSVNPHTGKRRIDEAFPEELRENVNDNEMFIRFKNGSTWQIVGSDRYDATVGAGVMGITYSEWALANPSAWAYHRPMLTENDGWALFISTPRGRNHCHALYEYARKSPEWFCQRLTVHDTGALTKPQLDETLAEYQALYGEDVGRAQYEQEYECSFNAAILGAFYALEMAAVRREDRISALAQPLPGQPVHRAWDLGVGDDTSIWWFAPVGGQLFILDHYASSGVGLEHYRDVIKARQSERGWIHGNDYVPHDAKVKEWASGRTRVETMQLMGLNPILVPQHTIDDGINAARRTLPLCVFHPRTEDGGISALEQYRREWDDEKKAFKAVAVHDWCFAGETKVLTRYGTQRLDSLPPTGEVLTPCGWKRYHSPRITRRNARLVEVRFADGLTVRCTPDHLFATASGWKSAEHLTSTTSIRSSLTPLHSIGTAAFIAYSRLNGITRAAAKNCIAWFGSALSVQCRLAVISTTETAMLPITPLPISNAFPSNVISSENGKNGLAQLKMPKGNSLPVPEIKPLNGIDPNRDDFGIDGMPSGNKVGPSGNAGNYAVGHVAKYLRHWFAKVVSRRFTAATNVRFVHIESVAPIIERADVWCLTVPDGAAFSLSNGAVVGNCSHPADAFRYLALSWRPPPRRIVKTPELRTGWRIPPPAEPQWGGLQL